MASDKERLAAIRERLEKATPGPWQTRFIYRTLKRVRESPGDLMVGGTPESDWADADLTANAPTDLRWLCNQLEAALCEPPSDRLNEVDHWHSHYDAALASWNIAIAENAALRKQLGALINPGVSCDGPCKECGRFAAAWYIRSHIWNKFVPEGGILCMECFETRAKAQGIQLLVWCNSEEVHELKEAVNAAKREAFNDGVEAAAIRLKEIYGITLDSEWLPKEIRALKRTTPPTGPQGQAAQGTGGDE